MVDKEEQGWGLARYSGKVSVSFAYEGQQHTHELRITRSKLVLFAAHWEFVIPGTGHRFVLCGRYLAGWDPEMKNYAYPARLKFQEISTRHCFVRVMERNTVRGHGYECKDLIEEVSVK